jgi:hypothetical protein
VTSLASWLATRVPAAPPALTHRMRTALSGHLSRSASEAPSECLVAGESLLADLLANGRTTREGAVDLLAADALVTYAFEALAEQVSAAESGHPTPRTADAGAPDAGIAREAPGAPDPIDALAEASMRRIAELPAAAAPASPARP